MLVKNFPIGWIAYLNDGEVVKGRTIDDWRGMLSRCEVSGKYLLDLQFDPSSIILPVLPSGAYGYWSGQSLDALIHDGNRITMRGSGLGFLKNDCNNIMTHLWVEIRSAYREIDAKGDKIIWIP